MPGKDDFYNVDDFNFNFTALEKVIADIGPTLAEQTDLSKTFDMIADMKGTTYTAEPSLSGGLETWTEKVQAGGLQLAERTSEERTSGWKVSVTITLPKREPRSQVTTWTEDSAGAWKGVTA